MFGVSPSCVAQQSFVGLTQTLLFLAKFRQLFTLRSKKFLTQLPLLTYCCGLDR